MTLLAQQVKGPLNGITVLAAPLELQAQTVILLAQRPRRPSRKRTFTGFDYECVTKPGYGVRASKGADDRGADVDVTLVVIEDWAL